MGDPPEVETPRMEEARGPAKGKMIVIPERINQTVTAIFVRKSRRNCHNLAE
jgi:hypothetical protein